MWRGRHAGGAARDGALSKMYRNIKKAEHPCVFLLFLINLIKKAEKHKVFLLFLIFRFCKENQKSRKTFSFSAFLLFLIFFWYSLWPPGLTPEAPAGMAPPQNKLRNSRKAEKQGFSDFLIFLTKPKNYKKQKNLVFFCFLNEINWKKQKNTRLFCFFDISLPFWGGAIPAGASCVKPLSHRDSCFCRDIHRWKRRRAILKVRLFVLFLGISNGFPILVCKMSVGPS